MEGWLPPVQIRTVRIPTLRVIVAKVKIFASHLGNHLSSKRYLGKTNSKEDFWFRIWMGFRYFPLDS